MNKRLVCLLLSILMLLTCVFTSCSSTTVESEESEETTDNSAKTITMWVVTNEETTKEAEKAVNDAFTKITKAKFKTNVVIRFCTEDEYYAKLEAAIDANQADIELEKKWKKAWSRYKKDNKGSGKDEATLEAEFYAANPQYQKFQTVVKEDDENEVVTEEETRINEFGIAEIKYPEAGENQVDIFYLSGYDKYMEYYDEGHLYPLNEELGAASSKLTKYISAALLNGVQIDGEVYAIPNNVPIGQYTYMMIDKEIFDKYYHEIQDEEGNYKINSVLDLEVFLNDVVDYNGDKTPDDPGYVVPLASTYQECLSMLCWYWDLSYVDQSVYVTHYDESTGRNYVVKFKNEVTVEELNSKGETVTKKVVQYDPLIDSDILYLVNEKGQYVDEEGNPLNYHYEIDPEAGWLYDEKTFTSVPSAEAKGAMYLVDENGNPVTDANDKRVIVGGDTKLDSNAVVMPTYYYFYDENAEFSILGTMMKNPADRTRGSVNLGFDALFTDTEYHELFAALKNYEYQEFFGEVKEGQRAAVSFVKGDSRVLQSYEENGVYIGEDGREYHVVVAEYPEATEEELYGNMFAVYANSNYIARSMEVITYLNTNKEMRDLLQYGIEGQHYIRVGDADEGQTIRTLSTEGNTYRMDITKTGNCFIATPPESMGADAWIYAKSQNNDSLVNPLLGFDFNTMTADSDYSLDVTLIDHIAELNAYALDKINECTDKESLLDVITDAEAGLVYKLSGAAEDEKLNKAINPEYDPENPLGPESEEVQTPDKSGSSPYTVYYSWLTTYGYLAEEEAED